MIKNLSQRVISGIRRRIFLRLGLTRHPKNQLSVISDLFILRTGPEWKTSFELLNINALLLGGFEMITPSMVQIFFFSHDGEVIKKIQIPITSTPRTTLNIEDLTQNFSTVPATFAIFHPADESADVRGDSLLAERGYVGYEFKGLGVKGYVHGNLDAIAYAQNAVEPLGNSGVVRRHYTVQHLLSSGAKYEFAFTNPTQKTQKITVEISNGPKTWVKDSTIVLKPLGSGIIEVNDLAKSSLIRVKSRLYLARPIVFRTTHTSMDVFHG